MSAQAPPSAATPVEPTWLAEWFDVHATWELWWLGVGFIAQALFLSRWIVQWIASEKRGESVVPVPFWWVSLAGASMLLVYYIGRREPIGVLSQLTGWTIYARNLALISRKQRRAATPAEDDS